MANVNTTRTDTGEPYKRKDVIFEAEQKTNFEAELDARMAQASSGVRVAGIIEDNKPFVQKYDPGLSRSGYPGQRGSHFSLDL